MKDVTRPSAFRAALHGRIAGVLRVALLLAGLLSVSLLLYVHSAKALAAEKLAHFGLELMAWKGAQLSGAPRVLSVNGLELHLVTASTPLPVHAALERFHAICRERGGLERPRALLYAQPGSAPSVPLSDGTLAWESATAGLIACLDTGHPLGLEELIRRGNAFAKSGDLSAFGELRYVLAKRSASTTTLLVLWTEGPTLLPRAFPATGDVPGVDPSDVPRPEGARRLISASLRDEVYSVTSYAAEATDPASLSRWYESGLARNGWSVKRGPGALFARRGERALVVRVAVRGADTVATLIVLS